MEELTVKDAILVQTDVLVYDCRETPPRLWFVLPSPSVDCGCPRCNRRLAQATGLGWAPLRPNLNGLLDPHPYVTIDETALIPETYDRLIDYMLSVSEDEDDTRDDLVAMVTSEDGFQLECLPTAMTMMDHERALALGL
jgi:hypothetical protein